MTREDMDVTGGFSNVAELGKNYCRGSIPSVKWYFDRRDGAFMVWTWKVAVGK